MMVGWRRYTVEILDLFYVHSMLILISLGARGEPRPGANLPDMAALLEQTSRWSFGSADRPVAIFPGLRVPFLVMECWISFR